MTAVSLSQAQGALFPVLEQLRREAGQYSVVCGARMRVLEAAEMRNLCNAWAARVCGAPDAKEVEGAAGRRRRRQLERRVCCERVRLFLRFDSVAGAFKAAEEMMRRHVEMNRWAPRSIDFFSTALYDGDRLGPTEGESLCTPD